MIFRKLNLLPWCRKLEPVEIVQDEVAYDAIFRPVVDSG